MAEDIIQPRLGAVGWARFLWRQLTSMRTAIFLLLLLAVAAVPGSIFPQRSLDAARVATYLAENPTTGPWLDRFSMFDVFTSPWFSAIYLLLVVSLVGCIVPRSIAHAKELRAAPPKAPARLDRLAAYTEVELHLTADDALTLAARTLRRRRFRLRREDDAISAEGGYLRESGNILFHTGLCAIILGVAVGHLWGWRGDVIVPVGSTFTSTTGSYDTFNPGPLVDAATIPNFQVGVDSMTVIFEDRLASQLGMPREFTAHTTVREMHEARRGGPGRREDLSVNHPVAVEGATVFLLGNGYAPVITVRDAQGQIVYREATPFLPKDDNYRSAGAIKVPSARPQQLGFSGVFLPTADPDYSQGPRSLFPDLRNPELALTIWEGELFPGGRPQNVYALDTSRLTQLTGDNGAPLVLRLAPGQSATLPGGRGTITFESVDRWAGLSVRVDPATMFTLVASLLTVLGLLATLLVRRRRIFVRMAPGATAEGATVPDDGRSRRTVVQIGALARSADPGLDRLVEQFAEQLRAASTHDERQTS